MNAKCVEKMWYNWYTIQTKLTYTHVKTLGHYEWERERFNDALNTFIYGYMASHIWLRTILIVRKETRCRHIGYSYRLTARVLLYAPSHRQDNTYHSLCYTSHGALAGMRNSSTGPPPWRIDPTTHRTMSERSTSELRPALHYEWEFVGYLLS